MPFFRWGNKGGNYVTCSKLDNWKKIKSKLEIKPSNIISFSFPLFPINFSQD